ADWNPVGTGIESDRARARSGNPGYRHGERDPAGSDNHCRRHRNIADAIVAGCITRTNPCDGWSGVRWRSEQVDAGRAEAARTIFQRSHGDERTRGIAVGIEVQRMTGRAVPETWSGTRESPVRRAAPAPEMRRT